MNEQFIILADKLNRVASVAESLTPEVIQQTLNFSYSKSLFGTIIFTLLASILVAHTYKLYKNQNTDWTTWSLFGLISIFVMVRNMITLFQIEYYPYSWVYSHFVG